MALDFLCDEIIVQGKRIKIPEKADCYRYKSGRIKFFRANSSIGEKKIPAGARGMCFLEFEKFAYWTYYGQPEFYDAEGNTLKIKDY